MKIIAVILTISDRRFQGKELDIGGDLLQKLLEDSGIAIKQRRVVPDEFELIADELRWFSDNAQADLVITTGGTGFTQRDITPEATLSVIERLTPGIDEALRAKSIEITPYAMLSRSVSGIRKETLIINLPGNPKAVREHMEVLIPVLPHAIQMLKGINTDHHEMPKKNNFKKDKRNP
ncbi:MAG: hypothetical protein A2161_14730 [Candidatus Schekmanbacteria bacterium RBG_13_48_7]|uniref:MoaB/Mog domain-containing protein n=1 Tax=Candidatus Schekmanbacteria bacterium RBG_13_48_7 TaxID=1817878 RepID=A0A1F7RUD6_9BACT|nr:MAG: hypothetical protein A2161_14730 [Candidatus Schekmanbacteria bacterium RBG_13_48_7]